MFWLGFGAGCLALFMLLAILALRDPEDY